MKRALIASVIVFVLMITFASVCVSQMAEKGWEKTEHEGNSDMSLFLETISCSHKNYSGKTVGTILIMDKCGLLKNIP